MTFIGDPEGLSDIALRRRTDAMLSSALKHGTTDHLAPHQRQIDGDKTLGVPPLKWTQGDTLGNIQALIDVSVESLAHQVPEVRDARYDFKTGTFRDAKGEPIDAEAFRKWMDEARRGGAAGVGRATLKRGILLNTLAHTPGGERPGLLERSLRQPDKLVGGDLGKTFYDRINAPSSADIHDPKAIAAAIADVMRRHGLDGKVSVDMVDGLAAAIGQIAGRYRNGRIAINAAVSDPLGVLRHEIIHALRPAFTKREWAALVSEASLSIEGGQITNHPR